MDKKYLIQAFKSLINVGDEKQNTYLQDLMEALENEKACTLKFYPDDKGKYKVIYIHEFNK